MIHCWWESDSQAETCPTHLDPPSYDGFKYSVLKKKTKHKKGKRKFIITKWTSKIKLGWKRKKILKINVLLQLVHFFFFFFFGGPWSESLLLPESELSEDEEEEEEEDEEELSSSLSLLLSLSSEEELEESLLSDDESSEELSESLLLSLESLDFFFIFFSLEPSLPGPVMLFCLMSFSFSFFFISTVLEGLWRYFRFPVHS